MRCVWAKENSPVVAVAGQKLPYDSIVDLGGDTTGLTGPM